MVAIAGIAANAVVPISDPLARTIQSNAPMEITAMTISAAIRMFSVPVVAAARQNGQPVLLPLPAGVQMVALRSRRLESVFGTTLDALAARHIHDLVPSGAQESVDLDFKATLYGCADPDKRALAGDVVETLLPDGTETPAATASPLPSVEPTTPTATPDPAPAGSPSAIGGTVLSARRRG
ncbi:hypothetical protein [Micromonospora sp. 4G55]|uniref:hypothetical protein n=1 Tax=Micromonospora sp. 4G55 TaxID=2806102 RepID=UPI001A3909AC|nr:hypothetical protein [Micromonospora sp. 4G55]MBM0256955.1 hypothetical protein [Micromonospora sp. 4G55]